MSANPEVIKSAIVFEIPKSPIPFRLDTSGPYTEISWPTSVSTWQTLIELRKVAGVGIDLVNIFPKQEGELDKVRLGSLRPKNQSDFERLDKLDKAEINDRDTSRSVFWERDLEHNNVFVAAAFGYGIKLNERNLGNALFKTVLLKEVVELLIETLFH